MATHGLPSWPYTELDAEDLPRPEGLLLEGMRRWNAAAGIGRPALSSLALPFIAENAVEAALPLDRLIRCGQGRFRLAPVTATQTTSDEAALLLALALAQRAPRREALAALLRIVSAAEAQSGLGHALRIGGVLRRAGLLMRNPLR
ncbi:hypothetical protein ACFOD4_15730 [Pseudoroseomonas globiformis]|uniref:Uncharacterized protein n=1 Tax=Teichococcus globiformis TaxID=2307229 RepID=A0ABV7G1F7_9PROT